MTKEKYEKPVMEVVELQDDVIITSGGIPYCTEAGHCPPVAVCQWGDSIIHDSMHGYGNTSC